MGAQVISGVGFLGVGMIIVTGKNQIKGLTTATGLWICACIGLAVGIGYMEGVFFSLVFVLKGEGSTAVVTIEVKDKNKRALFMDKLRNMEGLKYVKEL